MQNMRLKGKLNKDFYNLKCKKNLLKKAIPRIEKIELETNLTFLFMIYLIDLRKHWVNHRHEKNHLTIFFKFY